MTKIILYGIIRAQLNEYSYYIVRREEAKCRSGREAKFMRNYFQCTECGQVHYIDMEYKIDQDEIYNRLYCNRCETDTKQLWVGENPEDRFIYMDINVDPNYYLY